MGFKPAKDVYECDACGNIGRREEIAKHLELPEPVVLSPGSVFRTKNYTDAGSGEREYYIIQKGKPFINMEHNIEYPSLVLGDNHRGIVFYSKDEERILVSANGGDMIIPGLVVEVLKEEGINRLCRANEEFAEFYEWAINSEGIRTSDFEED
ncbi:MAG: hypothetical protein ABIH72_00205 [archaeon]